MIEYRASELGSCVRALVYKRLGTPENATPEQVQQWFDRGVEHEVECIAAMIRDGWVLVDKGFQWEVTIPIDEDIQVVGHLDATGREADFDNERVIEIKAPQSWAKWYDAHLRGDYSDPLMHRYAWQISVYMAATGLEAVIACLDDGVVKIFGIERPPFNDKDIEQRVLMVESLAVSGVMPECTSRDYPCPFFPRCTHSQAETAFDPALDSLCGVYDVHRDIVSEGKAEIDRARAQILEHLGERDSVSTEDWTVTRYSSSRTTYDWKKMRDDGIDVDAYAKVSESEGLRVTRREQ
jgi:hypothetical protein